MKKVVLKTIILLVTILVVTSIGFWITRIETGEINTTIIENIEGGQNYE